MPEYTNLICLSRLNCEDLFFDAIYVQQLGFEITDENPKMISLHSDNINLFIELGPVLEVTVTSVEEAKPRLVKNGCEIVKDEPDFPRCYVRDPRSAGVICDDDVGGAHVPTPS